MNCAAGACKIEWIHTIGIGYESGRSPGVLSFELGVLGLVTESLPRTSSATASRLGVKLAITINHHITGSSFCAEI
jgi:hypothetical protein